MSKPLYIPPKKRHQGVKTWCSACHQEVSDKCKSTGKPLQLCKNGDKHKFKIIARIPGTKDGRKTKVLETRDLDQAIIEAIKFKKDVQENAIQTSSIPDNTKIIKPEHHLKDSNQPTLLVDAIARFVAFLNGEGVLIFDKRHRSKNYLKDLEKSYVYLIECLEKKEHDLNTFTISQFLTENILEELYFALEHALKSGTFGETTYNKRIDCFQRFEVWLTTELKYPLQNLFKRLKKKKINYTPLAISEEDFERLLNQITPENGIKVVNYKSKKKECYFKPWLANGFKLELAVGARREELVGLKFSDIKYGNSEQGYIAIENYKVNRLKGLTGANKEYIPVAISMDLLQLLNELGYSKYKDTDTYILAPEIIENRHRMCDSLTKGFRHFYKQLNTGRELTFYSLKRTNITAQHLHRGKDIKPTHHSSIKVELDHYVDQEFIAKGKHGYKVFPGESNKNKGAK